MATFSVFATGTAPFSYRWSKDGVEIAGATSASYTKPTVALSDSGSNFQVTVSNASGSATSNTATLTAGPRAPAIGDLRYLLWEQVTVPWNNGGGAVAGLGVTVVQESATNALGTPLEIGSTWVKEDGGCGWMAAFLFLPPSMTGLDMDYE
ncbi:MAG: immunoglobulin domain-containing protein, partial [Terracidiphilus sp.]